MTGTRTEACGAPAVELLAAATGAVPVCAAHRAAVSPLGTLSPLDGAAWCQVVEAPSTWCGAPVTLIVLPVPESAPCPDCGCSRGEHGTLGCSACGCETGHTSIDVAFVGGYYLIAPGPGGPVVVDGPTCGHCSRIVGPDDRVSCDQSGFLEHGHCHTHACPETELDVPGGAR